MKLWARISATRARAVFACVYAWLGTAPQFFLDASTWPRGPGRRKEAGAVPGSKFFSGGLPG
ncbi:MAG: hypothetical protein EBR09_16270 [Proteobacteria bacterium]|nr:hypothetical protein [Pseudomonadota bacterium]